VDEARAHFDAALAIHRAMSDRSSEGVTLAHMASLLLRQGAFGAAQEALERGEALLREVDAGLDYDSRQTPGTASQVSAKAGPGAAHAFADNRRRDRVLLDSSPVDCRRAILVREVSGLPQRNRRLLETDLKHIAR
jgi:hypothetical protein